MTDTLHGLALVCGVTCTATGIGVQIGYGWGLASLGLLLIAGVVHARRGGNVSHTG